VAVSAEQLIALAKEAADLTNVADYVTDATWLSWINAAATELHRLVTNKFKATYFRSFDFTFAAGTSQLTLPPDFWRFKGLDIDPDTSRRREVRPYNFQERNQLRPNDVRNWDPLLFATDRFYNVIGSSFLKLQPQEQAAGAYRLYYTPKVKPLTFMRTIARNVGADEIIEFLPTFPDSMGFTHGRFSWVDVGNMITISGATNAANNGTYTILTITGTQFVKYTYPTIEERTPIPEFFPAPAVATVTSMLDAELEPFAEYVWLTAAIKSLRKEESFAQAKELADQRNLIRDDLTEALETDQGGPQTIVDTDDGGADL
jgi:hypothetical protein